MAEESSAKCHHGETSDKSTNLVNVHVLGEKHEYTKTLIGVELHGKETLEIVCTNEQNKANAMISRLWRKAGGSHRKIVGLGVHYTMEDEPPQMAAVMPKRLNEMLKHERLFTFAGLSIESDKEKMKMSGLPTIIPNNVIHPLYKGMKKNIDTQEDHKLWGIGLLPDNLIEYARVDAYATYKSWNMIDNITNGWEIAKAREADHYYDRPFRPF
ncbi:hypothetical protein VPH35_020837 [Triticum aestivum]